MTVERAFCLASGPSLTDEQIETVRQWRTAQNIVIVTNNTWERAQWADALYAMDGRWWRKYGENAKRFSGRRYCAVVGYGAEQKPLAVYGNSGAGALVLARMLGAKWIGMLGYDCRSVDGRLHHHADHEGMNNCINMHRWPGQFAKAKRSLRGAMVINFTPGTALNCFPVEDFEQWRATLSN